MDWNEPIYYDANMNPCGEAECYVALVATYTDTGDEPRAAYWQHKLDAHRALKGSADHNRTTNNNHNQDKD